jgi:hypothetical protein
MDDQPTVVVIEPRIKEVALGLTANDFRNRSPLARRARVVCPNFKAAGSRPRRRQGPAIKVRPLSV